MLLIFLGGKAVFVSFLSFIFETYPHRVFFVIVSIDLLLFLGFFVRNPGGQLGVQVRGH